MASFFTDLRYAVRLLLKNRMFTAVAVAALALGIGANVAIFSVVNAVLLQPLAYPEPERLVRLCRQFPNGEGCAMLLTIFGIIAVSLAAIGIYGLMSYSVEQGSREIGVRLALGAARTDIFALIVGRGMRLAGMGLAAGTAAALGVTRVLSTMLFGVSAADPASYALVIAMLAAMAFLACYLPARRAMRLDPIMAMRSE